MPSVSIKLTPLRRNIEVIVNAMLSPEAQSAKLAAFAREKLAEADQINNAAVGHVPPHDTVVDGSAGASEDQVRPSGTISYKFLLVSDLFGWIADQLKEFSPKKSEAFEHSFVFFADNVETDPYGPVPLANEYVFQNTQPYVRKIERGFSPQAPHGVFEAVAALARNRASKSVKVSFAYRGLIGGAIGQWAKSGSALRLAARHRRSRAQSTEWLTRSPAIVITVK